MTLLPDAPQSYAKSQRGPRTLAWCAKRLRSFADARRVTPRPEHSPEIEAALTALRGSPETDLARKVI